PGPTTPGPEVQPACEKPLVVAPPSASGTSSERSCFLQIRGHNKNAGLPAATPSLTLHCKAVSLDDDGIIGVEVRFIDGSNRRTQAEGFDQLPLTLAAKVNHAPKQTLLLFACRQELTQFGVGDECRQPALEVVGVDEPPRPFR